MLYRLARPGAQNRRPRGFARPRPDRRGRADQARPYALDGNDPVLVATPARAYEFARRAALDEARQRNPFDPAHRLGARDGSPSSSGGFADAVGDLLEAALLRPDGLPDATDARFLKAARALAPEPIPAGRIRRRPRRGPPREDAARRRRPGVRLARPLRRPVRVPRPPRRRRAEGVLERARRLAEMPALAGLGDRALFAAASGGELRRLAAGSFLYRAGRARPARSRSSCPGRIELVRADAGRRRSRWARRPRATSSARRPCSGRRAAPTRARPGPRRCSASLPTSSPTSRTARRGCGTCALACSRRLARLNDLFRAVLPGRRRPPPSLPQAAGGRRGVALGSRTSPAFAYDRRPRPNPTASSSRPSPRSAATPPEALLFREGDPGDALFVDRARARPHLPADSRAARRRSRSSDPARSSARWRCSIPSSPAARPTRARTRRPCSSSSRGRVSRRSSVPTRRAARSSRVLLCRLAARRCVETAERLARWRMMAGPG